LSVYAFSVFVAALQHLGTLRNQNLFLG